MPLEQVPQLEQIHLNVNWNEPIMPQEEIRGREQGRDEHLPRWRVAPEDGIIPVPDVDFVQAPGQDIPMPDMAFEGVYDRIKSLYGDVKKPVKKLTKKEEEESNLIRLDLDEAAKKLTLLISKNMNEDSEEFLDLYDTYYELLFKCRK